MRGRAAIATSLDRFDPADKLSAQPIGGGERDRTVDLLLAKQALSQLSYTPGKLSALSQEPSAQS